MELSIDYIDCGDFLANISKILRHIPGFAPLMQRL